MLKLYNALDRKITEFKPVGEVVKMYTCGPTVYYYAHIGNMRAYLFMDFLRRIIKYNNYKIEGVMNYTDVGHLTSDADDGEDKMEVASKKENKNPWEIANFYTEFFLSQAKKLNIDLPEHLVKATTVIDETIDFVKQLIENGFAYETSKGIYYDVAKYSDYGALSGVKPEEKLAGARIEIDDEKHNPADFALWVKAPKEHLMQWESPWGMGYPGWHIECSTMCKKFLGDSIDIHTGGIDHLTIHHENEIAQNYGIAQKEVVHRWMHVEFLQIDGGKMSKSLNNIYTIDQLESLGYDPLVYRYFCMNAHYSKTQNFTFEAMDSAKVSLKRFYELCHSHKDSEIVTDTEKIETYKNKFLDAINDNVNMPNALSVVWEMIKDNEKSKDIYELVLDFDRVLGLKIADYEYQKDIIPSEVIELANNRWNAKINKNWATADELRKKISDMGFEILDTKDSFTIKKK